MNIKVKVRQNNAKVLFTDKDQTGIYCVFLHLKVKLLIRFNSHRLL